MDTILSTYEKMRIRESPYFGIFHGWYLQPHVFHQICASFNFFKGCQRNVLLKQFLFENSIKGKFVKEFSFDTISDLLIETLLRLDLPRSLLLNSLLLFLIIFRKKSLENSSNKHSKIEALLQLNLHNEWKLL